MNLRQKRRKRLKWIRRTRRCVTYQELWFWGFSHVDKPRWLVIGVFDRMVYTVIPKGMPIISFVGCPAEWIMNRKRQPGDWRAK